jgi:hypothetical protein
MKLLGIASPFLTYYGPLDAIGATLVVIAMGAWIVRGRLRLASGAVIAFIVIVAAYPFVPLVLMGASWIDQRLPIFAALLLFAGVSPRSLPQREVVIWSAAFSVLFVSRIVLVATVWSGHNADLADMRQVISVIPPGSRVLVVRSDDAADPDFLAGEPPSRRFMIDIDAMTHLPSLLVIERRAFMPLLFADPRKQPLRVLPPYDRLAINDGAPPYARALEAPTARDLQLAPYLANWRQDYDWVLLLRPHKVPGADHLLPGVLELAAMRDIAAVYQIHQFD